MRPSATDSLYHDLELRYGIKDYELPADMCLRPLRVSDLAQIVELEHAMFPENERASPERLAYRLHVCPELSLGIFQRTFDWNPTDSEDAIAVASSRLNLRAEKLIGFVLATKMTSCTIEERFMDIPSGPDDTEHGHYEAGRFIGLHSCVVRTENQGAHLGYIMLKEFIQRLFSLSTADGIALIAHDDLLPFYEKHGFVDKGESACKYGGEVWHDLFLAFDSYDGKRVD